MLSEKKQFIITELDRLYGKLMSKFHKTKETALYFKSEGIRGCLVALRNDKSVYQAVKTGNRFLKEFVLLWNKQRKTKHKASDYEGFVEQKMKWARTSYKERTNNE